MSARTLRTIKIPDRGQEGSRIDRERVLEHFRELHRARTGKEPPEISIVQRDGYIEVSVKHPTPRARR